MKRFITTSEAADYLQVSKKTIYRLRTTGKLNYYTVGKGKLVRLKIDDIDLYMQQYLEGAFHHGGSNG